MDCRLGADPAAEGAERRRLPRTESGTPCPICLGQVQGRAADSRGLGGRAAAHLRGAARPPCSFWPPCCPRGLAILTHFPLHLHAISIQSLNSHLSDEFLKALENSRIESHLKAPTLSGEWRQNESSQSKAAAPTGSDEESFRRHPAATPVKKKTAWRGISPLEKVTK